MDELLTYYNRELSYLRKKGDEFAEHYPKVAGRLRLDKNVVEDPHVSRLIESFAFLTARIRQTLDDEYPQITESLMGVLYPDFYAPIPSMSVVSAELAPGVEQAAYVARGEELNFYLDKSEYCVFRTALPVNVQPIRVVNAGYFTLPAVAPVLDKEIQADKVLASFVRLDLQPRMEEGLFELKDDELVFYLQGEQGQPYVLREFLLDKLVGVAVGSGNIDDGGYTSLGPDAVVEIGFAAEDQLLDYDGRTSDAHRLLMEYFLLPEKFLFIRVKGLAEQWQQHPEKLSIYFFFDEADIELAHGISAETFRLFCTPVVNNFNATTLSINGSDIADESLLQVKIGQGYRKDIHRVLKVEAYESAGDKNIVEPFYSYHQDSSPNQLYWVLRRENSTWKEGDPSPGTDTYISFVDGKGKPVGSRNNWTAAADVVCTDRDLPSRLPFGPDLPHVMLSVGGAGLRPQCIKPPTAAIQPTLKADTMWELVTQLSLHHFSNDDGLRVLKETLQLHNFNHSREITALIDGLEGIRIQRATARVREGGRSYMCQGSEIELLCNEDQYEGNSLYLFGSVLQHFFASICTLNSYVQLSIRTTRHMRVKYEWKPKTGCQALI